MYKILLSIPPRGGGGVGLYLTLKGDHTLIQLHDVSLLLHFEISLRTTLSDSFLGKNYGFPS